MQSTPQASGNGAGEQLSTGQNTGASGNAKAFYDEKDPRSKMEELAIAAFFREQFEGAHEHTKEDFERVIRAARRNFDSNNFARDLANAKTKGLFNKGEGHPLSYYGQQYVEALPDREAVKAIRKPKGSRGAKSSKKTAKKKRS